MLTQELNREEALQIAKEAVAKHYKVKVDEIGTPIGNDIKFQNGIYRFAFPTPVLTVRVSTKTGKLWVHLPEKDNRRYNDEFDEKWGRYESEG